MNSDANSLGEILGAEFEKWRRERKKGESSDALDQLATDWKVSLETLRWLTLVPFWTVQLAAFCRIDDPDNSQNPVKTELNPQAPENENQELFDRIGSLLEDLKNREILIAQRMLVTLPPPLDNGKFQRTMVYRIHDRSRNEALHYLREKEGQSRVVKSLIACAERVLQASTAVEMPESLRVWAQLARRLTVPIEMVELVEEAVTRTAPSTLIPQSNEADQEQPRENKTNRPVFSTNSRFRTWENNLSRASHWVEMAYSLQDHLDPHTRVRLDRAEARLQLHWRHWRDLQQSKSFLERKEQIKAFEALIDGPDDSWALHYLGPGGYGKTMLARYLVAYLASDRAIPVARLDFDHFDPHYLRYQPGLLLSALAEELRLQAGQPYTFSGFDQSIIGFYEKYPPVEARFRDNVNRDWFNDGLFKKVLADFATALQEMGGNVLLVLDTCEELTRVRLAGQPAENVSATFEILEKLHELEPRLRVVFLGRRPLASSGYGWRYAGEWNRAREGEAADSNTPAVIARLAPRPYLNLFPVMGLSQEETETYLAARGVSKEFWKPIIDKTIGPAPQLFEQMEWNSSSGFSVVTRPSLQNVSAWRSNPFDVSLYADWVLEDPIISPKQVAETDFQNYVELRILGQARSELGDEFIRAVSLLGQFDFALLKATLGSDGQNEIYGQFDNFDGAFQAFSSYEWVTHNNNGWLEVQAPILVRSRHYFEPEKQAPNNPWEQLRSRAIAYLRERSISEARIGGSFTGAEVTLELLAEHNPADALDWLSRLSRIGVSWEWMHLATRRLLAVPLPRNAVSLLLQARMLVLQGACRLHLFGLSDLLSLWRRVAQYVEEATELAKQSPADSYEQSQPFRIRLDFVRLAALAGEAAACFGTGETLSEARWHSFWQTAEVIRPALFPRETGAVLAAIEAAVEARESNRLMRALPIESIKKVYRILSRDWQWNNSKVQPRLLAAYTQLLLGRAMVYEGQVNQGLLQLEQSLKTSRQVAQMADHQLPQLDYEWTYLWSGPTNIYISIELEWGRAAWNRLSKRLVENQLPLPKELKRSQTLEQDRLISLQLKLSEDLRPVSDYRLPELLNLLTESPGYSFYPETNAQRELLPTRIVAAKALAGIGRFSEALGFLDSLISQLEERDEAPGNLPEIQVFSDLVMSARIEAVHIPHFDELLNSSRIDLLSWIWTLEAMEGRRQPPIKSWGHSQCLPLHAHYRWRAGYALSRQYALNLVTVYRQMAALARQNKVPDTAEAQAHWELDLYNLELDDLESQLVLKHWGSLLSEDNLVKPGPFSFGRNAQEAMERGFPLNNLLVILARYQALTLENNDIEIVIASDLRERLGERYTAQLLLREGELLALRLPKQAVYLLDTARKLLTDGRYSDPFSAVCAGVCETQALIRSGQSERAQSIWQNVETNFSKFCAEWPILVQFLNLPQWKTLNYLINEPPDATLIRELFEKLDQNWRQWLTRLLFTGVALNADSKQWLNLRRALNSIVTASAEKESGFNLLPAELDGLLQYDPGSNKSVSSQSIQPKLSEQVPVRLRFKTITKFEISVNGTLNRPPLFTDEPISVKLNRTYSNTKTNPIIRSLSTRPWRVLKRIEGEPSQLQISGFKLPTSWIKVVKQITHPRRFNQRPRTTPIILQLQDGLGFLPWEALSADEVALTLQPSVALWRVTKYWKQPILSETSEASSVFLICDASLDELHSYYQPLREKQLIREINRLELKDVGSEILKPRSVSPRMVHLIVRSQLIKGTPRLVLNSSLGYQAEQNVNLGQFTVQPPRHNSTSVGGPKIFRGRNLAELFQPARLLVIQAQPIASPDWTSDYGYQASYLRAIAEEAFIAGIPAVLTIPPLTLSDSNYFISNFVKNLTEVNWTKNGDIGLIEAVSLARRELARQREETVQLALDICLYADYGPRINLFS